MGFPKEFLWGTATSACQIEGGVAQDGRTPSIWDVMSAKPEKIFQNQTPEVACDSYNRWQEDINNMIKLGVNAYRFSISWPRVMSDGTGQINQKGMDYYKKIIDSLLENNITPSVTLYHWDLPQILEEQGGWINRDVISWFGEYAQKMFQELGDVVPMWSTINEPIATYVGYAHGGFAPGHTNEKWGNQARHNILVAHGKAVEIYRRLNLKGKIGIVIDIWKRHPATESPEDKEMVIDQDERNWKFYTDPILAGRYSEYILSKLAEEGTLMEMESGDFKLTSQPLDYFGLNVYNRVVVSANQQAIHDFSQGGNFLNNRQEYYPKAVYDALYLLKDLYNLKIPVYITENGTFSEGTETVDPDSGIIEDRDRIKYLQGFMKWLKKAIDEGHEVGGYFLWSLMDNFEWTAGQNYKFGIIHTDFHTLERTWKRSAYWYRDFISGKNKTS